MLSDGPKVVRAVVGSENAGQAVLRLSSDGIFIGELYVTGCMSATVMVIGCAFAMAWFSWAESFLCIPMYGASLQRGCFA